MTKKKYLIRKDTWYSSVLVIFYYFEKSDNNPHAWPKLCSMILLIFKKTFQSARQYLSVIFQTISRIAFESSKFNLIFVNSADRKVHCKQLISSNLSTIFRVKPKENGFVLIELYMLQMSELYKNKRSTLHYLYRDLYLEGIDATWGSSCSSVSTEKSFFLRKHERHERHDFVNSFKLTSYYFFCNDFEVKIYRNKAGWFTNLFLTESETKLFLPNFQFSLLQIQMIS